MCGDEFVSWPYYLAFEVSCEGRVVVCQSLYAEVATDKGFGHVYVFDFYLYIVDLSVGLLGALKLAARAEEGGGDKRGTCIRKIWVILPYSTKVVAVFRAGGMMWLVGRAGDGTKGQRVVILRWQLLLRSGVGCVVGIKLVIRIL